MTTAPSTLTTHDHPEGSESAHDPHLAHHFESLNQQFEAAKLGMWLFLGTEFLLFGGLFCVYAVLRHNHPALFAWGSQFLDTRWGLINTIVLITSSLTMAIAVSAAQLGRYRVLVTMLLATLLGAATFMTVKYIEYHHKLHEGLRWDVRFYDAPAWAHEQERDRLAAALGDDADDDASGVDAAEHVADLDHGRGLWNATCRSCHGVGGEGVEGQGKDIRDVEFVTTRSDAEMLAFIVAGRPETDPLNTTGVAMPPKGGNPLLVRSDLLDVIALVRTFEGGAEVAAAPAEEERYIPSSSIPIAPPGPPGLAERLLDPEAAVETHHGPYAHHALDDERPANAHLFFGVYFCMTGLHGIHVLAGMGVITWLLVRAVRRDFGPSYFTPVDLGGLYWHVVDVIWIFLFPLLYLI